MLPTLDSEIDYTIDYIEINDVSDLTSHAIVSAEITGFLEIFNDMSKKLQTGDELEYDISDLNSTCITFTKAYTFNSENPVEGAVGSEYQYLNHLVISNRIMTSNETIIQSYVSTNNDVLSVTQLNPTGNTTFVLDYTDDSIDYDVEVVFYKGWMIDLNFSIYNQASSETIAKCLLSADDISDPSLITYSSEIYFNQVDDFSKFTIGLKIGDNYLVKITENTNYHPVYEEDTIFNLTVTNIQSDFLILSYGFIYPNGTQTDAIESASGYNSLYIPFFFTTTNTALIEMCTPYYWNLTITEHTIEFQTSIEDYPLTDSDSDFYYKYARATGWLLKSHIVTRNSNTNEILKEYELTTLNYELPQDSTTTSPTTSTSSTTSSTGNKISSHSSETNSKVTSFSLPPLAAFAILIICIRRRQKKEF